MIANELTIGQTFRTTTSNNVRKVVDGDTAQGWEKYPGVVFIDTETGVYGGLGGMNDVTLCGIASPATEKQIAYLSDLGYTGDTNISKKLASKLIDDLKPACHYCGMPATGHGFFGESCCSGCGG